MNQELNVNDDSIQQYRRDIDDMAMDLRSALSSSEVDIETRLLMTNKQTQKDGQRQITNIRQFDTMTVVIDNKQNFSRDEIMQSLTRSIFHIENTLAWIKAMYYIWLLVYGDGEEDIMIYDDRIGRWYV